MVAWAWRRHGAGGHGRVGSQWPASDPAFLNGMSPSPIDPYGRLGCRAECWYPYGRLGCRAECWSSSAGERRRSWRLRRRARRLAWRHGRGHGADAGGRGCGGAHHDAATALVTSPPSSSPLPPSLPSVHSGASLSTGGYKILLLRWGRISDRWSRANTVCGGGFSGWVPVSNRW